MGSEMCIRDSYEVGIVGATRAINSVGSKRGKVDEVLVRNYEVRGD